jgi:hypothetical protein
MFLFEYSLGSSFLYFAHGGLRRRDSCKAKVFKDHLYRSKKDWGGKVVHIPHLFSKVFFVQICNADISYWSPLLFFSKPSAFQRVGVTANLKLHTAKHHKLALENPT